MTSNFHGRVPGGRSAPRLALALLALVGAGSVLFGEPANQDPAAAPQDKATAVPDPLAGPDLVVNGETVSKNALRRQIVFSTEGRTLFELQKLQHFVSKEMKRQIAEEGKTAEDFQIDEAEVQAAVKEARDQVAQQYAGQDVTLEDVLPSASSSTWLDNLRLTKLFRRVFLPENPHDYPPITVAALTSGENGDALYKNLLQQWDATHSADGGAAAPASGGAQAGGGQKSDDGGSSSSGGQFALGPQAGSGGAQAGSGGAQEEKPQQKESASVQKLPDAAQQEAGQQIMNMILQQSVVRYLTDTADIQLPEDGISDDLLAVIDGEKIPVEPVWDKIVGTVGPLDVWRAKQWFVNTIVARQALQKAGAWLSKEDTDAIYHEYADQYAHSIFSIEQIATVIKKFPTFGNYMTYYQIQESFKKLSKDQMTDESLDEQGKTKTSYIVSQATVDADIILLSAYDFAAKKWKPDGWEQAAARAKEVAQKLKDGADWNDILDKYSEFYDGPVPTQAMARPQVQLKNKGRFRGVKRNDLMRQLEESDFSMFLTGGSSVTDFVFFDQAVGTIENPIKGPYGWYIPRLLRKTPASQRLSPTDDKQRIYLVQDWVADHLNAYVKDQVAKAQIQGM